MANIYIVYEIIVYKILFTVDRDFMLGNSLFGAVKLTTNADSDKYKYSGYILDLMREKVFEFMMSLMSSSVHIDNKKKDILILVKVPTQGIIL